MGAFVSRRAAAAREAGRKGGLATARNTDEDFKERRSSKAGSTTRDKFGIGYYRYIQTLRPKRKSYKEKTIEIIRTILPEKEPLPVNSLALMEQVAKQLS